MLHGARAKGGRQGSGVGSVAIDFLIVSPAGFDTRVFSHSLPRGLNLCSWGRKLLLDRPNRQLVLLSRLVLFTRHLFVFCVRRPLLRL
jgi:hypothetical protein